MNTTFFLVKFFRKEQYAVDFVNGQVFCNTLRAFKKDEASLDPGRADQNEGTTFWWQPGDARVEINGVDISDDLAEPLQIQMAWLDEINLFCIHACHTGELDMAKVSNETVELLRRELLIPEECFKLGEYAVVIKDVSDFVDRMRAAAFSHGYRIARGLVKYYDSETFNGSFPGIEAAFWKQQQYGYQREFRFAIDTRSMSAGPLCLEIGNLSDIAMRLRASELNGPAFLGGSLSLGR